MRIRTVVTLLILLCFGLSFAQAQSKKGKAARRKNPCANAQTQLEMNNCFCGQYQKADAELNRVYRQLLSTNAGDTVFTEKLKVAQRAWIAFRDAQLDAIYPATDNPRVTYGSVYPMCYCMAQQELTDERTKQLKRMLSSKEGDVCG